MDWERAVSRGGVTEWERADGTATVRVRERADGRYAVRFDRLAQAPGGSAYRHAVVDDRATATDLAASWRAADGDAADG